MGLDGQRARQRWVGWDAVCIFLNPTANNQYEAGIYIYYIYIYIYTYIIIHSN